MKKPADPQRSARIRRRVLHALIIVCLIAGCGVGLHLLRDHVERELVFPAEPPAIVLKNRPVWMSDFLARQIAETARPRVARSVFDHQMVVDAVELLRASPWIRQVHQVRRAYSDTPGDTLFIDCDYRTPVALVHWEDDLWLVDGDGVKLPEQFTLEQAPRILYGRDGKTNIRIIKGVRRPPPEAGQRWRGDDLIAGLDLVKLLHGRPYAEEIVKVNVENFLGRENPRHPQLVLVTKHHTEVRWGRPVNANDFFIEVSTDQKLSYMRQVYEELGRVDGGYSWINIQFDKITHPDDSRGPRADGGR